MLTARRITSSTAAVSSMTTPTLLMRAIKATPKALTTVVKATRIAPQITALAPKLAPVPSPTSWKPLQICGSVSW